MYLVINTRKFDQKKIIWEIIIRINKRKKLQKESTIVSNTIKNGS